MNLGRNSLKFTRRGFVRFRAEVIDGYVELCVEDSGPGIPTSKRDNLFAKFQESLDVLNQGTGIGLSLCENLTELLNGEILLDDKYDSGIEGCPGARFVVKLKQPPLSVESVLKCSSINGLGHLDSSKDSVIARTSDTTSTEEILTELPQSLSVLFVDDDTILRKLFCRSVKKVMPSWSISEASNGESALQLVDTEEYDLIFMDQVSTLWCVSLYFVDTAAHYSSYKFLASVYGIH